MNTHRQSALLSDSAQSALEISRENLRKIETVHFINTDQISGVFGEYPELTKAVCDDDVEMVSALCAKLYESLGWQKRHRVNPQVIHNCF